MFTFSNLAATASIIAQFADEPKQTIAAILQKSATPLANCVFVEADSAATSLLATPSPHIAE